MKKFSLLICLFFVCSISAQTISHARLNEVKTFIKDKKYSENIAIFIDFKIPSNKYRFFIVDLKSEKILEKAIVAHGSGSVIENSDQLTFSNTEGSYQSSLGKFEIANSYVGKFGKSYRLKGLEKSNDNALSRAIVIHSYPCINNFESEELACLSLGCPMLSAEFFEIAAKYIDRSKKPLLLYAYY